MSQQSYDTEAVTYAIQGYHQEHISYLQRAVFAEAEIKLLKDKLHQEQVNSATTIQGLNDEIANLLARLNAIQNSSNQTQ